jgi:CRISPR/Cas system-associated endoribonuclease Cas2
LPRLYEYESKIPVSHVILGVLGLAGVLSVAVMAPNAVQMLRLLEPKRWKIQNPRYRVNETLRRLVKEGSIILVQADGEPLTVKLTEKGKQRFKELQLQKTSSRELWDGKWRVVLFDILEERRKMRRRLREQLVHIGFRKLQNSVWIYPYECEEILALLKVDLKFGRDVLYFVTDKMEGDEYLRRMFSLPKR